MILEFLRGAKIFCKKFATILRNRWVNRQFLATLKAKRHDRPGTHRPIPARHCACHDIAAIAVRRRQALARDRADTHSASRPAAERLRSGACSARRSRFVRSCVGAYTCQQVLFLVLAASSSYALCELRPQLIKDTGDVRRALSHELHVCCRSSSIASQSSALAAGIAADRYRALHACRDRPRFRADRHARADAKTPESESKRATKRRDAKELPQNDWPRLGSLAATTTTASRWNADRYRSLRAATATPAGAAAQPVRRRLDRRRARRRRRLLRAAQSNNSSSTMRCSTSWWRRKAPSSSAAAAHPMRIPSGAMQNGIKNAAGTGSPARRDRLHAAEFRACRHVARPVRQGDEGPQRKLSADVFRLLGHAMAHQSEMAAKRRVAGLRAVRRAVCQGSAAAAQNRAGQATGRDGKLDGQLRRRARLGDHHRAQQDGA